MIKTSTSTLLSIQGSIKRVSAQTLGIYLNKANVYNQKYYFQVSGNYSVVDMISSRDKLPEGMHHNWNFKLWTEKDIMDKLPGVLNQMRNLYDKAGTADIKNLTFETFLQPLLQVQRLSFGRNWWYGTLGSPIVFPKLVAVTKELRDASAKAGVEIDALNLEMSMRKDIFKRLIEYKDNNLNTARDPEYVRFIDCMIREGKKNGLELDEEQRQKIKLLKKEITTLSNEFKRNISEDKTIVLLNESELAGLPKHFINDLEIDKETGKKKLSMTCSVFLPVIRKCHIPETRRKMVIAYNSRGGTRNEEILQMVIKLRQELANMLKYKTWAAYRQETFMAKNPETVASFLQTLVSKLQPLWKTEREAFLNFKAEECKKYGYDFNGELDMWDIGYYCNMFEERNYSIDTEVLKEYFPLETVTNGLLSVYSKILGLEFTKLIDPPVWHEDVFAFKVDDKESGELMGYVYMDLFPREGKYTHFCNHPIQSGALNESGVKEKTITCMICNFTPPSGDKPSLLIPNEVQTYFHEFGHAMHAMCSKAKAQIFWGTHVERDFAEAPSQMLENWVKQKEVLALMSGHYVTGESIPDVWIEKIKKADKANAGFLNLRQIVLASYDQKIHKDGSVNPRTVYNETMKEIIGMEPHLDTFFPGIFFHPIDGYDAGYYSYLWSEVYSADMYETVFEKVGPLDSNAGKKYRETILEKGGTVDGFDMLRKFLGRDPNQEAFLKSKGLL